MLASYLVVNLTSKVYRLSRNPTHLRKWLYCVSNSACNPASPHCICGSPGCHFHTHFTPSPVGVIISNHELIHISIVVGGNTSKCSPGRTPFGSPSHKQYKPVRVQGGISIPSELLSRSSLLLVNRRCTPCEPAPSLSFLLQLGGQFLREVSLLISLRSTCEVGLPWSRMWWAACRHCHPG